MTDPGVAAAVAPDARRRRPALTAALFAAKVAASAGLLWLATRGIDFDAALASVARVQPMWLALAPLAIIGAIIVNGVRWQRLLVAHGAALPVRRAISLLFVTQFFNAGLPSTLGGDAARIVYAVRAGCAPAKVIAATALDRFAGYSSVIFYSAAVVFLQPFGLGLPVQWVPVVVLMVLSVPAALAVLAVLNAIPRPAPRPDADGTAELRGIRARAVRMVRPFLQLRVDVWAAAVAIVVSLPIVVLFGVALFALNTATCGCDDLSLLRAVAVAGPMVLSVSVPISMAGWGVREVVLMALFGAMGLPPEQGLVTSILFGVAMLVAATAGLFVWLGLRTPPPETPASMLS